MRFLWSLVRFWILMLIWGGLGWKGGGRLWVGGRMLFRCGWGVHYMHIYRLEIGNWKLVGGAVDKI